MDIDECCLSRCFCICRELDVLSRKHTCFNLNSCATTLGSLSRLVLWLTPHALFIARSFQFFLIFITWHSQVQSLPRMIIKDEIGEQVCFSFWTFSGKIVIFSEHFHLFPSNHQVKYSLKAAKLAQSNASLGGYSSSASMLHLKPILNILSW